MALEPRNLQKFSPSKVSRYTVYSCSNLGPIVTVPAVYVPNANAGESMPPDPLV